MIVNNLKIKNYRNFKEVDLKLINSLNIFIGDNGQGKTNLLESIYLCSIGRTFRLNSEDELINFNENKCTIELLLDKNKYKINIELFLEKGKRKQVKINKVKLDKTGEMIGVLNNVIFTPDDMKIIKGSPIERRKFINIDISQIKPKYKYLLNKYKKIITQRNNILKNYYTNKENKDIIDIWNNYLIDIGTELIWYRNEYINSLKKYAVDIYSDISGNKEIFDLKYKCNIGNICDMDKESIKNIFHQKINKNIDNEIQKNTSMYGPHKDDLIISLNNKECKYFGSQGQQRSAILALKLGEIEIIKDEIGEYPILLLDDVLSELDNKRKGFLINYIKNIQTVITTTDDNDLINLTKDFDKKIFYINDGKIGNITN
ncbi:DNA replication and repair protein RecF [Sedimentibacter acidaminivorans]|uniref:DNA replication and repair protein RecF n=1 Tax=Sedimentibacter acidaminivorans TaxID=913099 RepID=A0ABS4GF33_9FIRM|nr:DNA replication/repair protein RecF [Sedimentibacter acidaminivorans]MBP1926301.1 DNA replication and repair protein RecF [Sedimentibacter acidaminivorans]